MLVLGAALAQASFFIAQKSLPATYDPLSAIMWATVAAGVLALPAAPGLDATSSASPTALLAVVYLGLGTSALGFLCWSYAAARVDVSVAASALYAIPPLAAIIAWLWLGEVPSAMTSLGGVLALAGVALATGTGRSTSRAAVGDADLEAA